MAIDEPSRGCEILASTLAGWADPAIAIAASRAGATGILNLENSFAAATARSALDRLARFGRGALGVKLDAVAFKKWPVAPARTRTR